MFSNNNFQFLSNITRIFTHFFYSHIFLHIFLNNNFRFLTNIPLISSFVFVELLGVMEVWLHVQVAVVIF